MGNQLMLPMVSRHPQTTTRRTRRAANNGVIDDSWASNGGVLPRDVLFEVLLRLPAYLLRAPRAVCRSWRSLLSDDPVFATAHAARHPGRRLLAVSARAVFDEVADLKLLDTSSGYGGGRVVKRLARCAGPSYPRNPPMRAHSGLILVVGDRNDLRVVDPFTGAVTVLPSEPGHRDAITARVSVLGKSALMDGLDQEGEYKVFNITVDHDLVQSCKVLTLGATAGDVGAWWKAPKPPAIVRCDKPWVAAVANGVVYVMAFHRRDKMDWIAAFDLGTEQWRPGLLRGPPASEAVSALEEMDGRLVAVSGSFSNSGGVSSSVDLWILMGCNNSEDDKPEALWQVMCTVPLSGILRWGVYSYEKVEEAVWVLNGGRVAFVVWSPMVHRVHGRVVAGERGCQNWVLRVYDPRRDAFKDVARLSNPTDVAIGACTRSQLVACYVDQQGMDRWSRVSHQVVEIWQWLASYTSQIDLFVDIGFHR